MPCRIGPPAVSGGQAAQPCRGRPDSNLLPVVPASAPIVVVGTEPTWLTWNPLPCGDPEQAGRTGSRMQLEGGGDTAAVTLGRSSQSEGAPRGFSPSLCLPAPLTSDGPGPPPDTWLQTLEWEPGRATGSAGTSPPAPHSQSTSDVLGFSK